MKYQVTSDNIEISPSMIELAKSKAVKIETRVKNVPEDLKSLRIVLNKAPLEKFSVKIEANIHGKQYFTDETSFTLENAIIGAVEELDRMLKKEQNNTSEWKKTRDSKRLINVPEN
jgi:ribosome-associated translation inhibitor RaiA